MATVSLVKSTVFGDERAVIADVTFSNSYTTGGEAITPSQVGLTTFDHVTAGTGNVTTTFYGTKWDYTNNKAIVFSSAAQVTAATDLSALTVRLKFIGK